MDPVPQSSANADVCYVWLLARILEWRWLGVFSQGRFPLCHWAVLITNLPEAQVSDFLNSNKGRSENDVKLGRLYQISRTRDNQIELRISNPFLLSELRSEWTRPSSSLVGKTDMTHDQIDFLGSATNPLIFNL